jgi:hypothetical protein
MVLPSAHVQVCTFHWLVLVVPQVLGKWSTYAQLKKHLEGMAYAKDEEEYERHWEIIQCEYEYAVNYVGKWHAKRHL